MSLNLFEVRKRCPFCKEETMHREARKEIQNINERPQNSDHTQCLQCQKIYSQGAMRVHEAFEKKYLARLEKKPQHLHFQSRHPVNFQVTYASDALRQLQDLGLIAKPTIPKSTAFKEQKIAEEGKENAPKLPLTSYLLFQRENRTKLREEFNKQTEFTSFPSYITSVWKALPKEKKNVYSVKRRELVEEFKKMYPGVYEAKMEEKSQKRRKNKSLRTNSVYKRLKNGSQQQQQPTSTTIEADTIQLNQG